MQHVKFGINPAIASIIGKPNAFSPNVQRKPVPKNSCDSYVRYRIIPSLENHELLIKRNIVIKQTNSSLIWSVKSYLRFIATYNRL